MKTVDRFTVLRISSTNIKSIASLSFQSILDYIVAILLLVALSFLPASSVPYLVIERMNSEKRVQMVAGVSTATYWTAAFIWDVAVRNCNQELNQNADCLMHDVNYEV